MLREARGRALAAGPLSLAGHEIVYAFALLQTREYLRLWHGDLYKTIYDAMDRGNRASAQAFKDLQVGLARAVRATDVQIVAALERATDVRGLAAALASEALLELGLADRRLGRDDEAQVALQRLVSEYRGSEAWPLALLLTGDRDLEEGRVIAARGRFLQLTRERPGPVRTLAYVRLAHALMASEGEVGPDPEASVRAFVVAIAESRRLSPQGWMVLQLRRDARRDLARAYAAARPPSGALDNLRLWGAGPGHDEDMTRRMGELLASNYLALDRPDAATSVLEQLATAFPVDPEVCRWRVQIVLHSFVRDEHAESWAAIQELLATVDALGRRDETAPVLRGCRDQAAKLLAASAREWHARGIEEQSRPLQGRARRAYDSFLSRFAEDPRAPGLAQDREALARGAPPPEPPLCIR
jgi:tetratricopeptide (TPR) repeat protein